MKKRTIFLFILILLIGVFLTGCQKLEPGKGIGSIGDMITGVLEAIFGAISTSPTVWMKFMLFIAVFAALYGIVRKIPKIEDRIDEKTLGILSFVVALATASLTSNAWLVAVFSLFQGAILAILFLIAPVATLFFMRHVWIQAKKEGHSVLMWFLVACAWTGNIIIWANMPVVTTFVAQSLGRVDLGLGFASFTENMIGYISIFGLIFAIIMIFASGAWERAGLRSSRRSAHRKGRGAMKGPGDLAQIYFGKEELVKPDDMINNVKTNIKAAVTKAGKKTGGQAPIKAALSELDTGMNAILASRLQAEREYIKAFGIDPKRAKKANMNAISKAHGNAIAQQNVVETQLTNALAAPDPKVRRTALTNALSGLATLKTRITELDTAIHRVEGLLQ
jgi:hypothetical protein